MILVILWEGFEIIILPRRVTRRFRLSRYFFNFCWSIWKTVVMSIAPQKFRETLLSFFGPISIFVMLGVWVAGLIISFAVLFWATGSSIRAADGSFGFLNDLYLSGTTFFTLGLGDVLPATYAARILTVLEAGLGFGFLALVVSYLPALNKSFASREISISLLDARAGSPPSAAEMLHRHYSKHGIEALRQLLLEWERWSAEFLEDHLSYPVLAYFRSQHENQSWLSALTAILDTCSLVMLGPDESCKRQAELTFAMARHAATDLSLVFGTPPVMPEQDRLSPEILSELRASLRTSGLKIADGVAADEQLLELRMMYEPYVAAFSAHFLLALPPWISNDEKMDNWQMIVWDTDGTVRRKATRGGHKRDRHF
jgi:hypothetical protein